ncbi:hypothetical protein [Streptomyces sp. BBFR102]|uniref:hypothetical protein n=1 Tax=Streptomyces sp. BBFR102 TaxID=3448171 RepID=UPI003F52F6E0
MITDPRPRRIARDVFHDDEGPEYTFPGEVRRWATGEPFRLATEECQDDTLIPTAVESQAMGARHSCSMPCSPSTVCTDRR